MSYKDLPDVVKVDIDGPVRIVTLNRPDAMNAFSDELHAAFPRVWSEIEHDFSISHLTCYKSVDFISQDISHAGCQVDWRGRLMVACLNCFATHKYLL